MNKYYLVVRVKGGGSYSVVRSAETEKKAIEMTRKEFIDRGSRVVSVKPSKGMWVGQD